MSATRIMEASESSTIKSARRALQILEHMKNIRRPAGTTDVAMAFDWPISSTSALLKSLASMGYLLFDPRTRNYQASIRVGLLGGWSYDNGPDPVKIDRAMKQLSHETGAAVFLATRRTIHVQYLQVIAAQQRLALPAIGEMHYLTHMPGGLLLLAMEDDIVAERIIRRINAETETRTVPVRETLAQIAAMRAQGCATHSITSRANHQGSTFGGAHCSTASSKEPYTVARLVPVSGSEPLAIGLMTMPDEFQARLPALLDALEQAVFTISGGRKPDQRPDHRQELRLATQNNCERNASFDKGQPNAAQPLPFRMKSAARSAIM